jgi:hypothetical protein
MIIRVSVWICKRIGMKFMLLDASHFCLLFIPRQVPISGRAHLRGENKTNATTSAVMQMAKIVFGSRARKGCQVYILAEQEKCANFMAGKLKKYFNFMAVQLKNMSSLLDSFFKNRITTRRIYI